MLTVGWTGKVAFDVYYNAQLEKIQNVVSNTLQDIAPNLNIFSWDLISYNTLNLVMKTTFETLSGNIDLNKKTTIYQKSGLLLILSWWSVYVYTWEKSISPAYTLTPKFPLYSWEKKEENSLESISSENIFPIPPKLKLMSSIYNEITEPEKILWIKPEITLIDNKNILYSYLGTGKIDFIAKAKELGWNIVEIRNKKAIIKNNLFGNIVSFINLPLRQEKKVCLIVSLDWNQWMIEIPYDMYYNSKTYLKNLFN